MDAEADCNKVHQEGLAGWAATVGRTGSSQMVQSESDSVLRFASNVWLYVAQLNRSMLQADGVAPSPRRPSVPRDPGPERAESRDDAPAELAPLGAGPPLDGVGLGGPNATPTRPRRFEPATPEQQLQRYKDSLGRNPVSSIAVPTAFEAYPQVARYALAACCHASEMDALLRFQALSAD